jgi:hypothetical protein
MKKKMMKMKMKEKKVKRKREVVEEMRRSKSLRKSMRVFSDRRCETLFVCHIGYALDFVY